MLDDVFNDPDICDIKCYSYSGCPGVYKLVPSELVVTVAKIQFTHRKTGYICCLDRRITRAGTYWNVGSVSVPNKCQFYMNMESDLCQFMEDEFRGHIARILIFELSDTSRYCPNTLLDEQLHIFNTTIVFGLDFSGPNSSEFSSPSLIKDGAKLFADRVYWYTFDIQEARKAEKLADWKRKNIFKPTQERLLLD